MVLLPNMADFSPELQAKLEELEQELEVGKVPDTLQGLMSTLADLMARRRETSPPKGKPVTSFA